MWIGNNRRRHVLGSGLTSAMFCPTIRRCRISVLLLLSLHFAVEGRAQSIETGRLHFNVRCAGCHGADGLGGERAAAIGQRERGRLQSNDSVRGVIVQGLPDLGMPGFTVPDAELDQLVAFVRSRVKPLKDVGINGDPRSGEALFFGQARCAECHAVKGYGGLNGPDLTEAGDRLTLAEAETSLRHPHRRRVPGYEVATVQLRSGQKVRGFVRNESGFDLQLQGLDQQLYLLSSDDITGIIREKDSLMPAFAGSEGQQRDLLAFLGGAAEWKPNRNLARVSEMPNAAPWHELQNPKPGSWPTYNGRLDGNRDSALSQITPANVGRLAPKWIFPVEGRRALEATPIVVDGVMYVTSVNAVYALDARSGRKIWEYTRPRSNGLVGDAAGGINRGVAVLGSRVFVVTDNAHLLALHAVTGGLLWDTRMADSRQHYGATSAPLVIGDLVISGVSGGDEGIRGFLSAYRASTGERVWQFWTIPAAGEPEASTWQGRALEHGCGAAWFTGTYDVETGTLFWPVGNPCPDFNGDERKGDNLYTDSVIALDPKTGRRKWHYQFTPHDLHDWDATETPVLVDANYHGQPRKLLLQANRNGFFYVLDRGDGRFLSATPFVKKLTWAKSIGPDGRPVLGEGWQPTAEGTLVCPSMDGASNWMSPSYSAATGMFYLIALEKCNIFHKSAEWWKQGQSFYGGAARSVPDELPRKYVRAIDLQTGKIAWKHEQTGPGAAWGGLLTTASGLLFFCNDNGAFSALDAKSGRPLWNFQMNARWHASPMTYFVNGRQYIAVAAGASVVAFAMTE